MEPTRTAVPANPAGTGAPSAAPPHAPTVFLSSAAGVAPSRCLGGAIQKTSFILGLVVRPSSGEISLFDRVPRYVVVAVRRSISTVAQRLELRRCYEDDEAPTRRARTANKTTAAIASTARAQRLIHIHGSVRQPIIDSARRNGFSPRSCCCMTDARIELMNGPLEPPCPCISRDASEYRYKLARAAGKTKAAANTDWSAASATDIGAETRNATVASRNRRASPRSRGTVIPKAPRRGQPARRDRRSSREFLRQRREPLVNWAVCPAYTRRRSRAHTHPC